MKTFLDFKRNNEGEYKIKNSEESKDLYAKHSWNLKYYKNKLGRMRSYIILLYISGI